MPDDMSAEEARACADAIRQHLDGARQHIYALWSRRGWLVLGYKSWSQCVAQEFGVGRSQVYRELSAAKVEISLSPTGGLGVIPERALRELARLAEPEARQAAWDIAQEAWAEAGNAAPMPSVWVKAAVNVAEVVRDTGGHVALGGDMAPATPALVRRAVAEEATEIARRQAQHIRGNAGRLLLRGVYGDVEAACAALRAATGNAACFRVLVYEEVGDGTDDGTGAGGHRVARDADDAG